MICDCVIPNDQQAGGSYEDRLGGSVTTVPIPLSNGINIPILGIERGYADYYTTCVYLPAGTAPAVNSFIQLSQTTTELGYFEAIQTVGVLSYPAISDLQVANAASVDSSIPNQWKIYPTDDQSYYVFIEYIEDEVDTESVRQHYNVSLVGYDAADIAPFSVDITLTAADKTASFTIALEAPYLTLSDSAITLAQEGGTSDPVDVLSNVLWRIEI